MRANRGAHVRIRAFVMGEYVFNAIVYMMFNLYTGTAVCV